MADSERGSRELEHTADWELEVWAPDLEALLAEAALGMVRMMGIELADGPRSRRRIELEGFDRESLLVELLEEILYLGDSERLGFDVIEVRVDGGRLTASLEGAPVRAQAKEIKAVTFHRLKVRDTDQGVETRIVFDV